MATGAENIPGVVSGFLSHVRTGPLSMAWAGLGFRVSRSFVALAADLLFNSVFIKAPEVSSLLRFAGIG